MNLLIALSIVVVVLIIGYYILEWGVVNDARQHHRGCESMLGIIPRDHVQPSGYGGAVGYGRIHNVGVDGVNRKHGDVYVECARCKKEYPLVMVHQHRDK